jgi:phospholipid/cholesterol/gamma-HCH transport system substrate-binding protein
MRFSNEIKAGLVVLIAIGLGVFLFTRTGNQKVETYDIKTSFTYAGDLKTNAVVKLSGIEVGRVRSIQFVYDAKTRVECVLEIVATAKVRKDAIAYIGTAGFVGDAFIGLTPGESAEFVASGETVASEDPVQMRLLMKKADDIANNLDNILVQVKSIVTDNRKGIDSIVVNLEGTSQNFKEFSDDIKKHPWKLLFKGE